MMNVFTAPAPSQSAAHRPPSPIRKPPKRYPSSIDVDREVKLNTRPATHRRPSSPRSLDSTTHYALTDPTRGFALGTVARHSSTTPSIATTRHAQDRQAVEYLVGYETQARTRHPASLSLEIAQSDQPAPQYSSLAANQLHPPASALQHGQETIHSVSFDTQACPQPHVSREPKQYSTLNHNHPDFQPHWYSHTTPISSTTDRFPLQSEDLSTYLSSSANKPPIAEPWRTSLSSQKPRAVDLENPPETAALPAPGIQGDRFSSIRVQRQRYTQDSSYPLPPPANALDDTPNEGQLPSASHPGPFTSTTPPCEPPSERLSLIPWMPVAFEGPTNISTSEATSQHWQYSHSTASNISSTAANTRQPETFQQEQHSQPTPSSFAATQHSLTNNSTEHSPSPSARPDWRPSLGQPLSSPTHPLPTPSQPGNHRSLYTQVPHTIVTDPHWNITRDSAYSRQDSRHQENPTSTNMGGGTGDPWIVIPVHSGSPEGSTRVVPLDDTHHLAGGSGSGATWARNGIQEAVAGGMILQPTMALAPRGASDGHPSTAGGSTNKPRSRFEQAQKQQTAETRRSGACIRCSVQRLRCIPLDPTDPGGCCRTCSKVSTESKKTIHSTLCRRYRLPGIQLAREGGLNLTRRWQGTELKDVADRVDSMIRVIEFKIVYTSKDNHPFDIFHVPIRLEVQRFWPREGDVMHRKWTNNQKETMFTELTPFALHSIHATSAVIGNYISSNWEQAMIIALQNCQREIKDTYSLAVHHWRSLHPRYGTRPDAEQHRFMGRLFQLWFAMRLSTGSAYIFGEDKLDMYPETREGYPLQHRISLPRMITAQLDSILTRKYVKENTRALSKDLNAYFRGNNPDHWLTIYVTVFILLHEISVATKDRKRYAEQNNLDGFSLPEVVEEQHKTVNALLAYWHYFRSDKHPGNTEQHATEKTPMCKLGNYEKQKVWFLWRLMSGMLDTYLDLPKEKALVEPMYFVAQMYLPRWREMHTFER